MSIVGSGLPHVSWSSHSKLFSDFFLNISFNVFDFPFIASIHLFHNILPLKHNHSGSWLLVLHQTNCLRKISPFISGLWTSNINHFLHTHCKARVKQFSVSNSPCCMFLVFGRKSKHQEEAENAKTSHRKSSTASLAAKPSRPMAKFII